MGNRISNATGLDGVTGYAAATGTDEVTVGAPGRIVIVGTSGLSSPGVAVVAGEVVDAFAHFAAAGGAAVLELVVGATVIPVPIKRTRQGAPRRGLPRAFDFGRIRVAAPASGTAFLRVTGPGACYLLKPFIDAPVDYDRPSAWQAGPHANPDLNLFAWPSKLPVVQADGFQVRPTPTRKAFSADAGVPITRQISSTTRYVLAAELVLTLEERDRLERFAEITRGENGEPFYFVRYDTQQVCRAYWMEDGDPADAGTRAGGRRTGFSLLLEVA